MTNLEYYRAKATEMRELADGARNPDIRRQFMILAAEYVRLGIVAGRAPVFSAPQTDTEAVKLKLLM